MSTMRYRINIEAPANGKVGQSTVTVLDEDGRTVGSDKDDLFSAPKRAKLVSRLAPVVGESADRLGRLVETAWNGVLDKRRQAEQEAAERQAQDRKSVV